MRKALLWLCCSLIVSAHAETELIKVIDGDTVIVRHDGQTMHVRLLEIDAPELHQPYGKQSKRSLQQWCLPPVTLSTQGTDKYGRTLGYLSCKGEDASQHQIAHGAAWFNRRYGSRQTLAVLEQTAREQQQGLWQDPDPMPPWVWRKRYGNNYLTQ